MEVTYRGRSPEEWVELYNKAMMFSKEGLGYKRIARILGVSKNTVSGWIHHGHKPYWYNVNLTPSKELSYIIGVFLGDGYIIRRKSKHVHHGKCINHYIIGLRATDKDFVQEFARCLSVVTTKKVKLFKIPSKKREWKTVYGAEVSCMILYNYLQKIKSNPKNAYEAISKHPSYFLRGFFDSEGSVRKDNRKPHNYTLEASNTNPKILRLVQKILLSLGIKSKINGYKLYIPAKYKSKFANTVGFTIKRKKARLTDWLKTRDKIYISILRVLEKNGATVKSLAELLRVKEKAVYDAIRYLRRYNKKITYNRLNHKYILED